MLAVDALTVTSLTTWTPWVKLLAEQLAELDVDGGHDRGSLLDLSLTVRPRAVNASAIPKLM